jgi:CubicO group peptidase (beta-lactamase class C family)
VTRLPRTEELVRRGLTDRVYTAVSAEIGNDAGPLWAFADGHLGVGSDTRVDASTVFDLASLTKVLAATTAALLLTRRGVFDLQARVGEIVREWRGSDRREVTLRDLLEHASGLPAHREYYRRLSGLEAYVSAIAAEPLEHPPRSTAVYSDLGFIVLGAALERLAAAPLDEQFDAWKTSAGVTEAVAFRPPSDWKPRIAATGFDGWRGRALRGEVHDGNAAALDGVAAHAGLFGTAAAVGAAARWWLRELRCDDAAAFAQRSTVPGSSRALGWDTMLPTSSCGTRMSPTAIGHTGFTGTSLWLDPARGLYFVLLTNRVALSDASEGIQQIRRGFHDTANEEIG